MLMMCYWYCVSFAEGMFYASALLLILFSLFVLKRGIRRDSPGLRLTAFMLTYIALLKICILDIYLLRKQILCGIDQLVPFCNAGGVRLLQGSGLLVLILLSFLLFNYYRSFLYSRKPPEKTPQQAGLPFWSALSVSLVMVMILWLAAPWAGYLTVGHVPVLFMQVPWQHFAVANTIILLIGFWKVEDCRWTYDSAGKTTTQRNIGTWTSRDTLWLSLYLFLAALAFSYASSDALSVTVQRH